MSQDSTIAHYALLLGFEEPSIFQEYIDTIANKTLLPYKAILQHGGKAGQSLYMHILNGICLLERLRDLLGLDEVEARILFTAYTLHDINKVERTTKNYGDLVTPELVRQTIIELALDGFFPEYSTYLADIVSLMRGHSGHHHHGLERLDRTRAGRYGLDLDRVNELLHVMRALDNLDLAHTLDDTTHLDKFLSELNAVDDVQYTFVSHRLGEHRGILTNLIHNAVVEELQTLDLRPLLFFPEGVLYLAVRGVALHVDDGLLERIGQRIASSFSTLTAQKFEQFIDVRPLGIRIDPKCLELGLPFQRLFEKVHTIIERRTFKPDTLAEGARRRATERLRTATLDDMQRAEIAALLASEVVPYDQSRLRLAELIRTYYIFLNEHFKAVIKEPWEHLYHLLELPIERRPLYEVFDARQDRAYILVSEIALSEAEVRRRIEEDGAAQLGERQVVDPRAGLFATYLRLVLRLAPDSQPAPDFHAHLQQYVTGQHRQCVMCSSPFLTTEWMKPDVRSDIGVNAFSNRLRGGPGEPKKRVCPICQLQFLLEKLAFAEVKGEKLFYLHLFPYSFLTGPFIEGLRATVRRVTAEDDQARALFLRPDEWIRQYDTTRPLSYATRTNKGASHFYGIYIPRYAEMIGNLIILPLNAPGANDTEQFLYTLQQAMLLQLHLGLKVLISSSPVPPLDKQSFADLYIDNLPLAMRGLLPQNDYAQFADDRTNAEGQLPILWRRIRAIHNLRQKFYVAGSNRDVVVEVSRALGEHPLAVFYVADRLLEERMRRGPQSAQPAFARMGLATGALADLHTLTKGDTTVALLSDYLRQLAAIASEHKFHRPGSYAKNSLMMPFDEVFKKINHGSAAFREDEQVLRAVIAEDIFAYLKRVEGEYKRGATTRNAAQRFVALFFDGVYADVYKHNRQKLLADERFLRSAFYFYIQEANERRRAARATAGLQPTTDDFATELGEA